LASSALTSSGKAAVAALAAEVTFARFFVLLFTLTAQHNHIVGDLDMHNARDYLQRASPR
jgi:hypothetical protein